MGQPQTPKETFRQFKNSEERILVLPFDGRQEDVSRHWHRFLKMSTWELLHKTIVLSLTRNMYSGTLKNTLLRSIGVKIGKHVFIAATVQLDIQFPELITIEDGAILEGQLQHDQIARSGRKTDRPGPIAVPHRRVGASRRGYPRAA